MSLRAQTVRRLAVLFAAVLVMVGTGAALYWRNEHQKNVRMAEARTAGMAAYQAGDYRAALDSLKYYVAREKGKEDPEALYAYGVSRSRLEEPNGKHISEGITAFNAVLQLEPGHAEAKHRLLELYPRAAKNTEAIELADRVLVDNPSDVSALNLDDVVLSGPPDVVTEAFRAAALATIRRRTIPSVGEHVSLRFDSLGDDDVLLGAAVLVRSAELGVA